VLVSGGSRGIGLAVAKTFVALGDSVASTYHSSPPPEGVLAIKCNVTDPSAVDAAFAEVEQAQGAVQVLVCCAGITRDKLFISMSDDDFVDVVNTNLVAAARMARRAARKMMIARSGRIILLSSVVGLRGEAGQANYAASKAGLIGLARSLARELGPRGITTNVVAPGLTNTDMARSLPPKQLEEMIKQIPLRRIAEPEDIAGAVVFLASSDASYINGAVLAVDGGVAGGH
jgi:3-oxoacyl-[acyl-carrier protein] reductase